MASKTSIFLTGATGYIGGAVLARLLNHPSVSTFAITALVRNPEKAKILESQFGVKAVVGNHHESDKVESLAEGAHVVLNLAEADNVPFMKAILRGLRKRHDKLGDLPILIHTSGAGELADDARGEYVSDVIYDDLNVEQYKSIPETAVHRNVDLLVINADVEGYARTYIVPPTTVYDIVQHPLVEAGVSNPRSIQIPTMIEAALARKQAGVVGKGKAVSSDVHIDDVADLYIVLYDAIVANPEKVGHGWEGIYFGENGEHSWYQISKAIGEAMVALGISTDPEPTSFTTEEMVKYFGSEQWGWYCGANTRCRGNRARALGWKPKYTTEVMLKSIRREVEEISKKPPRQPPFWPGIPPENR
ncbi:NAD-P-binding protein [Polyporus arcularius HHB13444]|uniref:NAD-P-binding protein n=1 Tax=Polyporus arcularius HHB13444 TaxID=1314778 RepID=A0A5C3PS14_9APHY|nr:NAD-P-binding protein [Polyporus arcularius HHB13444]